MAKKSKGSRVIINLVSESGSIIHTTKNNKNTSEKMKLYKYDKKTGKRELFTERKMPKHSK